MKIKNYVNKLLKSLELKTRPKNSIEPGKPKVNFMALDPRYEEFEIGEWTYGSPMIKTWEDKSNIKIGKYCSIAKNVQFLVGGEHRTDWITTYPFNIIMNEAKGYTGHPASKGDITVGHDVWIGQNAIILSGVNIGNGAVIGAASVVTKDIPQYAIAAGNPAKIIRFRFSGDQITELEKIKWWEWDNKDVIDAFPFLLSDNIEDFIQRYK